MNNFINNQIFSLKETSEHFDIPVSKILFWEKAGLLNLPRLQNGYRYCTYWDHCAISDILFYKKLGFSIQEIESLSNTTLEGFSEKLFQSKANIRKRILDLLETENNIDRKLSLINTTFTLQETGYREKSLPVEAIIPISMTNYDQYTALLTDLEKFTSVIEFPKNHGDPYTLHFGLIVPYPEALPPEEEKKYLFIARETEKTRFVCFFLKVSVTRDYDDIEKKLLPHLKKIESDFGQVERVINKYLITAYDENDDMLYDYLDSYAQLK